MALELKPFCPRMTAIAYRHPARDSRITLFEGSVRSTKTYGLHPKAISLCDYKVGGDGLFTGVSKGTIYRNVLSDLFSLVGRRNYNYNRSSGELHLLGRRWWVVGAADEGSEKFIQGMTIGRVIADEATRLPESYWKMLLTRMSPEGARLYATLNPANPFHYLKVDYLDNQKMRDDGILHSEHFTIDDNPTLTEEYKAFLRSTFTGVFYQRYILGKWVIAEGAIYRDSLGPQCEYDDDSRPLGLFTAYTQRIIAVDYGTSNPMVYLDVYDYQNVFWQEREYYWDSRKEGRQKTNSEYADDMEKFVGPNKRGVIIVVDPSAASFKIELVRRGFLVKDANNDVILGIQRVSSALKIGAHRIHKKNNTNTLKELATYAWNDEKAKKGKEEPIKENDHSPDAVRYCDYTMMPAYRVTA